MPLDRLEPGDLTLIRNCLEAAATGPFFPDWEFETLFGLSRDQLREIMFGWPQNASEPRTEIAVRNAIANLRGYPHNQECVLEKMLGVDPERLYGLSKKIGRE